VALGGASATAGLTTAARVLTAPDPAISTTEGELFSGPVGTATCPPGTPGATSGNFTINWGDGKSSPGSVRISGQNITVSGTHVYVEESPATAPYGGSITGTYLCGSSSQSFSAGLSAFVADAPLTAALTLTSAFAGQAVKGQVATFTDADTGGRASDYTATINWGDGTASGGQVVRTNGGFAVNGAHTYGIKGTFGLSVRITDQGGASAMVEGPVAVTAPATAHFTAPTSVKAGGIASFDATASHPSGQQVVSFKWILTGPGVLGDTASVNCAGYTSELQTGFSRGGAVTAKLVVSYGSTVVSTASHRLEVSAKRLNPIASWADSHVGQWFLCKRGAADAAIQATNKGGPPKGCQDQYYNFQVAAIGCFTVLGSRADIPKPEYDLLCPYFFKLDLCSNVIISVPGLGASPRGALGADAQAVPDTKAQVPTPLPPVMSTFPVRVNGIDIAPDQSAAFVLDMNDGAMASSRAVFSLLDGRLPVKEGRLITATFNVNGDLPLFDGSLDQIINAHPGLRQLLDLAGFQIGGTLTVQLAPFKSNIGATLTLPSKIGFSDPNDNTKTVTSMLTATADNKNGLVLDDLFLAVPSVNFGKTLKYDHLNFCYQRQIVEGFCQAKTGADFGAADGTTSSSWNATVNLNLLGVDINAVPPPPDNGIGFVDGNFAFAGLTANDLGIPIGHTGVVLESIGAGFGVDPTRFNGQIGISALHLVEIDGCMFMVFASPDQPYSFTGTELGGCGITLPTPTTQDLGIAVGGDVGLILPAVGNQKLANGYVLFTDDPGYLAAGGSIHFDPLNGALVLDGRVDGQFALDGSGNFDIEGHLHVHALFIDADADGVLSSKGIGVCGSVSVFGAHISAGAGYQWGGGINAWIGSCDLSPYRVTVTSAALRGAAIPAAGFRLPGGLPSEMVKVIGRGGAPDITIKGPGGIKASTNGGTSAEVKPFAIFRVASQDTTYIAIIKPPKGQYTVTANAGSPAITKVMNADGLKPSVRASLTRGRRGKLLLHFTDTRHPGQRVVFAERAKGVFRVIGTTTAARGTFTFTPAPGPGGKRSIVAEIVQDGAPVVLQPSTTSGAGQIVVASYRAAGPPQLGRVQGLTVSHSGTQVHVSWGRAFDALGYEVTLVTSSGRHEVFRVHRTKLVISDVFGEFSGKVIVRAIGDNVHARSGPVASASFRRDRGD
jgi:hypothetical protein